MVLVSINLYIVQRIKEINLYVSCILYAVYIKYQIKICGRIISIFLFTSFIFVFVLAAWFLILLLFFAVFLFFFFFRNVLSCFLLDFRIVCRSIFTSFLTVVVRAPFFSIFFSFAYFIIILHVSYVLVHKIHSKYDRLKLTDNRIRNEK